MASYFRAFHVPQWSSRINHMQGGGVYKSCSEVGEREAAGEAVTGSREIFLVGLDNMLHVVKFENARSFSEPKPLFRIPGFPQYGTTRDFQFDVSPDGQRFVFPTTGSVAPPPFTLVENWQEKFDR